MVSLSLWYKSKHTRCLSVARSLAWITCVNRFKWRCRHPVGRISARTSSDNDAPSVMVLWLQHGAERSCLTREFDKREGEAHAGTNIAQYIAQYTHVTSQLSVSCGYNILTSQALRFGSIISDRADFIKRCCMLLTKMVAQGYAFTLLKRKLKAFLQRHKITVDHHCDNAPNRLFNEIMGAYEQASC